MNTKLRTEAKYDFFKLMNNVCFGRIMENIRKNRDIKLVATNRRRNYLVLEPNYHATKFIRSRNEKKKKTRVKMNKPVDIDLSILEISKTLTYEFWYDSIKLHCQKRQK